MLQACEPQATAPVRLQRHAARRETDLCPGADLQLPSGQWGWEGQGWGYVCVLGGVTQIHNPLTYNCQVVSGGGRGRGGVMCVCGGGVGVTQIHNPLTYNCQVVSGGWRGRGGVMCVCVWGGGWHRSITHWPATAKWSVGVGGAGVGLCVCVWGGGDTDP